MPIITFGFLTPEVVQGPEIGREFFELIRSELNGDSLGRYGEDEPLRRTFAKDFDGACAMWAQGLFWEEQRADAWGFFFRGTNKRHGNIQLYYSTRMAHGDAWTSFLKKASRLLHVDFSCAYWREGKSRTKEDEVFEGIQSYDLEEALPTIAWASCFGKPYLDLIGKGRFQSAGFDVVEFLSEDLVFCQLTADPMDYLDNYETYYARQEAVKTALGRQYFLGSEKPIVPQFHCQPRPA